MKSLLAATMISIIAFSPAALAEDKAVYTSDVIEKIHFSKDQVSLILSGHKKKGEFGCKDPHYVIGVEAFGHTFGQVVQIVTDAAVNHAQIGLQVASCSGEDKEGASIVTEVKLELHRDNYDRPGSYRQ